MDHTRWSGRSCLSCLAAFALLLVLVRRNITNQGGNSLNWWPASPVLAHTAYLRLRCSSVYLETTPGDCAAVPGNATRESHEKPYCYPALRCSLALALGSTQKGILVSPGGCAAVPGNATRESHETPYCYPALRCSLALALDSTQKGIPMSRVSILSWCMHPSYISKALVGIQQQLWRCAEMNENDWQYLACSCIAYNHHMMSWVCASQLCAAAGTAHEPP
jgi:hypothetical protein